MVVEITTPNFHGSPLGLRRVAEAFDCFQWVPSLTDADGYFYPTLWRRQGAPAGTALREAKWTIEDVEKEMRAQIELAKRKVPHVSHMSCHMGCSGWDPKVQALWKRLAKE